MKTENWLYLLAFAVLMLGGGSEAKSGCGCGH
jgi:hypothetical protein